MHLPGFAFSEHYFLIFAFAISGTQTGVSK
jgi:hypothetical protein